MNNSQYRVGDQSEVFIGHNNSMGTGYEKVWQVMDRRSPQERFTPIQSRSTPTYEINRNIKLSKILGTDFGNMVRVMPPIIQEDTFLDNEVGITVHYIKEKFGSPPLLKAYHGALDTLKESDRRWREYMEEEARIQSIFEAGED